jgi:GMP synthase-like glutamine amidotransferase
MPKPLRICCLECDVFKDFPPAVSTKQYYGEIVQDWLRVEAGEKWGQFHCNGETRVWQFCCLFCNLLRFSAEKPQLPVVDDWDVFIIPGSRCNVDDGHAWITAVCALVREAHSKQKALIGMCFGHQLVAHALGGVSSPAPPFNIGVDEITLHSARARQLLGGRTSFKLVRRYYSMGKADLTTSPHLYPCYSINRTDGRFRRSPLAARS